MTAHDLVVGIMLGVFILLMAAPGTLSLRESVAMRNAVHETTVAFFRARAYAISRDRNVGLKFRKNGERYEWALYADGNGNGVRTAEIASGMDRYLGVYFPWSRNDVRPAIMTGTRVPDPSTPGRYLDRIDDPIRFNNSDICSFSPVGDSTPGSVFLWDAHDRMAVVRVFGGTAKIRTLYYRRGARGWTR
jgi:Tfp pilus assembly protein FimT